MRCILHHTLTEVLSTFSVKQKLQKNTLIDISKQEKIKNPINHGLLNPHGL